MKLSKAICLLCYQRRQRIWFKVNDRVWHEHKQVTCLYATDDEDRCASVNDFPPKCCRYAAEHIAEWAAGRDEQ